MTVDNKGRQDSCQEVCHHAVGDYSFLTQKKKIFPKIIFSPPFLHFMNPTKFKKGYCLSSIFFEK
jgi:hypothetical protein